MQTCKSYVGLACVNGTCPMANEEEYMERCIPIVENCEDCSYNRGCEDCGLFDTEYCGGYLDLNLIN